MHNRLAIRWPLWVVLNVPFALILVVSAALIGFLGIQNGTAIASDLTKQLLADSAARVQQDLDSFLDTARLLSEQNLEAIRLHQLDLNDVAALQRRFLAELRAYPTIQDVVYGSEQLNLTGAWRNVWGAGLAIGEQTEQSNFTFRGYEAGPSGEHGRLLLTINANDFRPRPWYQAAMQAGHLTWTPVYTWVNQLGIAVDAVNPVYDDSGVLLGVLDTSLNPASISANLKALAGEQNINIFIVDDSGLLVASSTMPQPFEQTNGVFQRFGTLDSSDPFIQSVTQQVGKQFGGWSSVGSSQQFEFEQAGETSLAQVTPYEGTGSQWRIVVAIPETTYLTPINQHIGQTLLLIFVSLIVSVGLLTLVSQRITRPILRLSQVSKAFASGNWSVRVPVSRQNELGELAISFNQMADQLQQSSLALQASETQLRAIFENAVEAILVINKNGIVAYNPACQAMFLVSDPDELSHREMLDFIMPDERPRIAAFIRARLASELAPAMYETRGMRQDGSEFYLEVRVSTFVQNGEVYALSLLRDISERKQADAALRQSEARFRSTFEQAAVGMAHVAPDGHFLLINRRFCDMLGYSQDEMLTKTFQAITHPDDLNTDVEQMRQLVAGEIDNISTEKRYWRKDQTIQWAQLTVALVSHGDGTPNYFISVVEDIAERKQAEDELLKASRTLALLSAVNQAIVRIRPQSELFEQICAIAVETGGFRMAWIGLLDSETQRVTPVAWKGFTEDYLRKLDIALVDGPHGQGPTATALRTGEVVIVEDIEVDPRMEPWRADALRLGYRASVGFPLKIEGKACGVLNLYAAQPNFFNEQELTLLSELGNDISFAMEYAAQEEQRFAAEQALKTSEARFRTIIEAAPLGIAFTRGNLFLYTNQKYLEMFGYQDAEELKNQHVLKIFAPQVHKRIEERIHRRDVLKEPVNTNYETIGVRKDGSEFPFELWVNQVDFADGRANVGFHLDLTERKQAEAAQRASEARYRELVENMPAGLILYDAAARVIFANKRAESVLRLSHEQIMAYSGQRGISTYTREDGSPLPVSENPVYRVLASGEVVDDFVVGINRHDLSEMIWLLETIYPVFDERHEVEQVVLAFTDITQRKQAEEQIRQSEEKFRKVFAASPDHISLTSLEDGVYLDINDRATLETGYSREEYLGHTTGELNIWVDPQQRTQFVAALKEQGFVRDIEQRARYKSGELRDRLLSAEMIDLNGQRCVLTVSRDITDRKQAQAELAEQKYQLSERMKELSCLYNHAKLVEQPDISLEALFQGTVDLMPPAWQYPDITCARLTVENRSYMTGNFKETAWRQSSDVTVSDNHVGTLEVGYLEEQPDAVEGPFVYEERLLIDELARRLGQKIEALQAASALRQAYTTLEERVTRRTAQLQAAKDRVEAILNSSVDSLLLADSNLHIRRTNAAFDRQFVSETDGYFERSLADLIDSDPNEVTLSTIRTHMTSGQDFYQEIRARRRDGTVFDAEMSVGYINNNGLVCVIRDITERKQAEAALLQALAKEKELNELKSRFVSMASHEFRTPLATILALVETLSAYRHKLEDDEIEDLLAKIKDQVGHLKDIMEDVLLLARMQARRVQFNSDLLDLDAFCRSIVDEFQSRPDVKHRLSYSGIGRKCEAMLDRKLMRQVISNLLSNAIKYSSETKPIRLELECSESTLVLKVRDEGIGIPEADLPYLFEPFHRAENVGTISGTGLGLVITKESVELHGGTIAVDSQLGVGTTLTIQIPVNPEGGMNHDPNSGN